MCCGNVPEQNQGGACCLSCTSAVCEVVTGGMQEDLYRRRQAREPSTWRSVRTEKPFPGLLKFVLLHFACEPRGSVQQASPAQLPLLDPIQKGLCFEEAEQSYLSPGGNMRRWKESRLPLKMM